MSNVDKKTGRSSKRLNRLFKEGSWIVLGQVLMVLGSLFGVRLLTELLSPEKYGELALGITFATLINQVILGPLGQGVLRFYVPATERGELERYLQAARRLVLIAIFLIIILALFCTAFLAIVQQSYWIAMLVAAFAYAIVSGCNAILNGIQNAARQRSVVALHQGIEAWARFLIAAALVALLGEVSSAAMFGFTVGSLVVLSSQILFFRKTVERHRTFSSASPNSWQKKIWTYSWPFATFGIFTWGQLASDRWGLGLFGSTQDVGMYAVLFQLGFYPISLATGMAGQFIVPILFQRAGDASDQRRRNNAHKLNYRLTIVSFGLTVFGFLLSWLLHKQIFGTFVASEYSKISYLFPWMVLSGGIMATAQTLSFNFLILTKTKLLMYVKISTSVVGIFLNLLGAYWYGLSGVIAANLIFSSTYFIFLLILSHFQNVRDAKNV